MHGVKKVKRSPEALAAKKLKDQAKLKSYLELTDETLRHKDNKDWSKEALDLTTRVLQVNPEFYTIWNYRRNILIEGIFPESSPEHVNDLLSDDLSMTTAALKSHPKVYWIWNHRRWCLEHVPSGPGTSEDGDCDGWRKANWEKEMYVVERMLEADSRNFHAWAYRRYVLASMTVPRSETAELAYTTRHIESNFSNFSAWHQRSKVLSSLWAKGALNETKSREQEFELVHNAMYTDPDDQSVWIYHRWLIGAGDDGDLLRREIDVIQELLSEQPDSKWCMESIVHYKRLVLKNHDTSEALVQECIALLSSLRQLDSGRRARYDDIEQAVLATRS